MGKDCGAVLQATFHCYSFICEAASRLAQWTNPGAFYKVYTGSKDKIRSYFKDDCSKKSA